MHRSSISQYSKSVSHSLNDIDELTDAEIIKQVNELRLQNKILSLENEIIEKTIMRLDPALMHGVQQALDYAMKLHSNTSLNVGSFVKSQTSRFNLDSVTSPSRMLISPSKVSTRRVESSAKIGGTVIFKSNARVNVLERSEIVSTEMEILVRSLERCRKAAAKQQALLKAQLEEVDIRVTDIDKALTTFNQQVVVEGWDKIAQRIPAEIWIRFMTEWMKASDSQIGKLRLRTSTLNTQHSKVKGQIKQKTELSESLRPVDFEKLKIENDECLEIIENKFQQLVELKKMTGEANLNLAIHKKAMTDQNNYLSSILKTIKAKDRQTKMVDKEREIIKVQVDVLAEKYEDVKKTRMSFLVPDVMDYVKIKAEVTDLKHSIKLLKNREHIQSIAFNSLSKKLGLKSVPSF